MAVGVSSSEKKKEERIAKLRAELARRSAATLPTSEEVTEEAKGRIASEDRAELARADSIEARTREPIAEALPEASLGAKALTALGVDNLQARSASDFISQDLLGAGGGAFVAESTLGRKGQQAGQALQKIPHPVAKALGTGIAVGSPLAAGALGAGLGSGTAVFTQRLRKGDDVQGAFEAAKIAGGQDAVLELAGNTVFRSIKGLANALKVDPNEIGRKFMGDIFDAQGASPITLGDLADNALFASGEELLRAGAFASKGFVASDTAKKTLVKSTVRDVVRDYTDLLSDDVKGLRPEILEAQMRVEARGMAIRSIITSGEKLHKAAGNRLFAFLDVGTANLTTGEKGILVNRLRGAGDSRPAEAILSKPVDMRPLREEAEVLRHKSIQLGSGRAKDDVERLISIMNGADFLTFRQAHDLLSGLKATLREIPAGSKKELGIHDLLDKGVASMDKAGAQMPSFIQRPDGSRLPFNQAYAHARNFFRRGQERLKTDFLSSLLEKSPTAIGKALANAPPEHIREMRRVVISSRNAAARLEKEAISGEQAQDVAEEMRRQGLTFDESAIEDLQGGSVAVVGKIKKMAQRQGVTIDNDAIEAAAGIKSSLKKKWAQAKASTLEEMLESEKIDFSVKGSENEVVKALLTSDGLKDFNMVNSVVSKLQKSSGLRGSLASRELAAVSAGTGIVTGLVAGSIVGGSTDTEGAGLLSGGGGAILGYLLAPRILARVYTSPKILKKIVRWDKAPVGTAKKARFGAQAIAVLADMDAEEQRKSKEKRIRLELARRAVEEGKVREEGPRSSTAAPAEGQIGLGQQVQAQDLEEEEDIK